MTTLQPHAKNVLVIGLSTGSWVQVLASMPDVDHITVVEINPSYRELIEKDPQVSPLLDDPRIEIVVDDGRKWLRRHPDVKFDIVLMNTTYYWRAYATNLLSQEFLRLVSNVMTDNGVLMYNTTGADHSYTTAMSVFPNVYQYVNMAVASRTPIKSPNNENLKYGLGQLRWQTGERVFNEKQLEVAVEILQFMDFKELNTPKPNTEIITDNNMITEFKYGKNLLGGVH